MLAALTRDNNIEIGPFNLCSLFVKLPSHVSKLRSISVFAIGRRTAALRDITLETCNEAHQRPRVLRVIEDVLAEDFFRLLDVPLFQQQSSERVSDGLHLSPRLIR
jgi:hypothetical protein